MIEAEKCLVLDVDGTLCRLKSKDQDYADLDPIPEMIEKVRGYKAAGFHIILSTARNMRTYDGNIGKINANTTKVLLEWLERHDIPFDELHVGKPWAGKGGFYVDDRAIRPSEFLKLSYEDILALTAGETA
jgi:capsule biosynthesis phosphatase